MKKETKDLVLVLGVALLVMLAVPLAYRVVIHFYPPEEKAQPTLAQVLEDAQRARCLNLLTTPVAKWPEAAAKAEPEIYAWLQAQGNEILPWDWTDEARRKDPGGYAACWRRIWKDRKSHFRRRLREQQGELRRLAREHQTLCAIHDHRTNEIARLLTLVATNVYPSQITISRLEKGRLWGWNKHAEAVACADAASAAGLCSNEVAVAAEEGARVAALGEAVAAATSAAALSERMCETCEERIRLVGDGLSPDQEGLLQKALVDVLKEMAD